MSWDETTMADPRASAIVVNLGSESTKDHMEMRETVAFGCFKSNRGDVERVIAEIHTSF